MIAMTNLRYYDLVVSHAKDIGKYEELLAAITYLDKGSMVVLSPDFAAHSFTFQQFTAAGESYDGESYLRAGMHGGLIFDRTDLNWSIHT